MLSRPQSAYGLPSPFDLRMAEETQAAMPSTFDHRLGDDESSTPVYAPSCNIYDGEEVPRGKGEDAASDCSSEETEDFIKGDRDGFSSASTVHGSSQTPLTSAVPSSRPSLESDATESGFEAPIIYNEPEVIACGSPLKWLQKRQRQ
jgi:hypothetical protein